MTLPPIVELSHPCGGACCRDFVLSVRPERFAEYIEFGKAAIANGTANDYERDAVFWIPHIHPTNAADPNAVPRYRCDLLDDATGRCTVYATRPRTCREYPAKEDGGTCRACGFTNGEPAKKELELVQLTKAPEAT